MPDGPVASSCGESAFGDEEALLLRAGRGDRRAFEALYDRFARPLMAFLTSLTGDAIEAQDLVQETFVRAWRAAPRWEPRGRASTWLFTIARRTASNWRVARSVRVRAESRAAPRGEAAPLSSAELPQALAAAVQGLSEPLRTVFVLVRLHGRSLVEAAEVEAIPVGTVKSRLAAAEVELRRVLRAHVDGGGDR